MLSDSHTRNRLLALLDEFANLCSFMHCMSNVLRTCHIWDYSISYVDRVIQVISDDLMRGVRSKTVNSTKGTVDEHCC